MKIAVLGAGGFGIALAVMSEKYGHNVTLWSAFENEIELLTQKRANERLLPGIRLPDTVALTANWLSSRYPPARCRRWRSALRVVSTRKPWW